MLALAALLVGLLGAAVIARLRPRRPTAALTVVIVLGIGARLDRHRPLRLVAAAGATASAR